MTKREWLLDKIDGKTDTVPVGFWFHYLEHEKEQNYFEDKSVFEKNVQGHRAFSRESAPDFIKLMSDGFFNYPNEKIKEAKTLADAQAIQPIGKDHPWITKQVELVQNQIASLSEEVATFYNIFAPATYFKFLFEAGDKELANHILADPELTKQLLAVIAEDIAVLAEQVITQGGATGIYLSVQNVQDERITSVDYLNVIRESDLAVVTAAKQASKYNILHICGYEGSKNDLSLYQDYDFPVVNWAVNIEHLSLKAGKDFFKDKVVLGGFDNRPTGVIAAGTKEEVEAYTKQLLAESGTERLIIGADCTLPFDIDRQRIQWVKDAVAKELGGVRV